MPESSDASKRSRSSLTGILLVTLAAAALLLILQRATPGLHGYDGYFHIRYAQVLRSQGISRSFPWWQETFLRDHFADKDFLYHVLLIPFTFSDLILGGKLAAALFGSCVIGAFCLVCLKLRVPWPAAWGIALLSSSAVFIYRLDFTRPLVMAVALALAGTGAILLGNPRWAFALAAIYPNAHISFHLLPCVALLHDLVRPRQPDGVRSFRIARWTVGGAVAGALLSPYVPNNLVLWWVQNIRVLEMAWTGPADLRLGAEIHAGTSADLLKFNIGVFAALFAGVYLLARGRRKASPEATTLLLVSTGFFGLALLSRRFIEFWTPFTFLLAAVAVRDRLASQKSGALAAEVEAAGARHPAARRPRNRVVAVAAGVAVAGMLAFNAGGAWRFIASDAGPSYAGASEWMNANVPAGETVFHLDWDEFPQLFFFNPQLHYLVGLDPTFMYVTSPSRWRLWNDVAHAEVDDIYTPIRKTFRSRWVLAIHEDEDFLAVARRDPRFFQRYSDPAATVFFLADGFSFVTKWRVTGWYANPARRLYEARLPGEPEAYRGAAGSTPGAEGPGSGETESEFGAGFVDLARELRLPEAVQEACGVAQATLDVGAGTRTSGTSTKSTGTGAPATLAVTTDDEVRVYLNDEEVLAYSPFMTPPPGESGGEAATIDEFLDARAHVPERNVPVLLKAGTNTLTVKDCRAGADFGFFLRVYLTDGTELGDSSGGK